MKQILFLDDDPVRTSDFRSYASGFDCVLVTVDDAQGCIEKLGGQAFDLVLLDHDLGGETFVDSARADTGMEVVRWLRANGGDHKGFIVHTMNPVAAAGMYIELRSMNYHAEQAPFGSPDFFRFASQFLDGESPKDDPRSFMRRIGDYFRSLSRNKM